MRIDAHQHFWKFDPVRDSWIDATMSTIQRDFFPADLKPLLDAQGIEGCVIVQSDQSEAENVFQLKNSEGHDFVKGVVGWVDLQADDVEDQLVHYKAFPKMKGFRHVLQGEPQRDYMLNAAFMRGVGELKKFGYTYDILIYQDQLAYAEKFVKAFPDQPFVLDHMAKPSIRTGDLSQWKKGIQALAAHDNVWCKVSGMVTEADWKRWKPGDFVPYLDTVTEAFGTHRLMFGSDWPVCLVAAAYAEVYDLVRNYFSSFSAKEQDAIFGINATKFYNL
ncbi:amidohydrolase family protein [Chryseolinea soli]|uniref:Amidohydrolase n=1 Tax=Chryseolinea soli TaxID=2321403 RepID=A0A385SL17_9BACT|nr:amidohydrolase family protein [Chryseolinea soli]AYB32453.1 amidohydrolase [Chryseolinea soli]